MDVMKLPHWSALRASHLKPRAHAAHKGDFGHVLVVGGDQGMDGAVRLAATAALRTGAGLVSVVTRQEHVSQVNATRPELMCHGVQSPHELAPLIKKASVVVVGPGLGQSDWSRALLSAVLASALPLVVDADALNLLSQQKNVRCDHWVLTPHPGEASRLLNCSNADVQKDRLAAVTALQARFGGVCVLKGAGTLILGTDHKIYQCEEGNPGMASAGMGDVLAGIIGAWIAQGFSIDVAAQMGVAVHAAAGDRAATTGERGLLASDLIENLRALVNE
jgi:hydroxyethylthiazole kinase-like uncharacterized protein yjeF